MLTAFILIRAERAHLETLDEGIAATETQIASQVFSRHDLARMWSLGIEPPAAP